jgi:hypothetical protein
MTDPVTTDAKHVPMDTSSDDPFQMKARSRPVISPDNPNDIKTLKSTQDDITSVAKGDAGRRARTVTDLTNVDLQLPFWPLYHIDNQKATEYRPGDRLAVRVILPAGHVDTVKKTGKVEVKEKVDTKVEAKTELKTEKVVTDDTKKTDKCTIETAEGKFFNHDCIEVFLIGEIQFVHPKDPLLNGEGVLYKLIPKQVVVDPPEYQKYVVENFVPESKYLGVPIVYWLGVYEDLMSATIFVTSAYKSLQQIVDDIGQENLDPTTRMAEYDVLAIRRSRMQGRFGLRESQVKINPTEFLGKEAPLPSAYGKTIVERKIASIKPQVRMFAFELPRKRKRATTISKSKRFR